MNASVEFEIRGCKPLSLTAKPWRQYLRHSVDSRIGDLALAPLIFNTIPLQNNEDYEREQGHRLRWLSRFMKYHPNELYAAWMDNTILMQERKVLRLSEDEFQEESRTLGLHMIRAELSHLNYYVHLRNELAARIRRGDWVLIIGPSSGAEAEIVRSVNCAPYVCPGYGDHATMCEERLLHDRIQFETLEPEQLDPLKYCFHHIIFTHYVANQEAAARTVYNLLGYSGWVYLPSSNAKMVEEFESLEFSRRSEYDAVVYFKHAGLPRLLGED